MNRIGSLSHQRACLRLLLTAVLSGLFAACESEKGSESSGAKSGNDAKFVSIAATNMQSGFASGTLRRGRLLRAYRITRSPVTWAEFDACIKRGACEPADSSECPDEESNPYRGYRVPQYRAKRPDAPATCVGRRQAEAYCASVGGRLPTLDEWELASRGATPQRYSWGDSVSACDQHPLASQVIAAIRRRFAPDSELAPEACDEQEFTGTELTVGAHSAGASPSGLEDVLLTPGELVAADPGSQLSACAGPCVVFGMEPAAIDGAEAFVRQRLGASDAMLASSNTQGAQPGANDPVELYQHAMPTTDAGVNERSIVSHVYAFRCVLPEEES